MQKIAFIAVNASLRWLMLRGVLAPGFLAFNRSAGFGALEHLKNSKNGPVLYLGLKLTIHDTCHQKTNRSRETVPYL